MSDVHSPISNDARRSAFKIRLPGSRLERHVAKPWIIVPGLEDRWRSFSSTIRLRQACRSPYSLSTRSSFLRMACSIRAISRRAALSGSGTAEGPDAVDVLVQFSRIVPARSISFRVRTDVTP